mgnify:FL=1
MDKPLPTSRLSHPALVWVFLFAFLLPSLAQQKNIVKTENGFLSGFTSKSGDIRIYKGVPFAAPPVGELRWASPKPSANWEGIRPCDKFPASAMQPTPVPFFVWSKEFLAPPEPLSEDCLYLNVWTPAKKTDEKLPVIVWIHGGGFMSGAGSCPIYDGEGMAKKGVVFVTINYRLGVFGFLAHPELTAESGVNASGNYAFLDQIAALQWVQKNIAAFGGDPNRVTIAGQSAGAFAVNALVASPLAKGLFHRAIAESGGMFNNERIKTLPEASIEGLELMKKLKANNIAELRKMPASELLKAATINSPVLDGYVLPKDVFSIFSEGKQNDVPVLTGWNRDEGFIFGEPLKADAFREQAEKRYGSLANEFLKAFPANNDEEAMQSQKNLSRDEIFAWQAHTWANLQSKTGHQKVWLYRFDRVPPGRPDLAEHGAFHSAEIAYALNSLPKWDRPWEPLDRELSEKMSGYWVNFAATGDPNGMGLPVWTVFEPALHNALVFSDTIKMREGLLKNEFNFLDKWQAATTPDLSLYKKMKYVSGKDTLPYRVLFPENFDSTKKYPLVLFLHGGGERGNDNEKQLVHGARLFLKHENRRAYPCIVIFPQCPADSYWGSAKIDRTKNPIELTFDYENTDLTKGLRLVLELTKNFVKSGTADASRIYVTGLSMGGMGTFEAVYREPEFFAAAVPICGGGDVMAYSEKMAKVPFRIFHGAADAVVKVQQSRDMYDRLKALGFDIQYTEYPAVNHNSWDYAFAEKDFLKWMFSCQRKK